jgi:hypothetical protein
MTLLVEEARIPSLSSFLPRLRPSEDLGTRNALKLKRGDRHSENIFLQQQGYNETGTY